MMGHAIIRYIMETRLIGVKDFFGRSRLPHLVRARRDAIEGLRAAGFNTAEISRLMKRNYSTIQYWSFPAYRQRQLDYCNRWHQRRAEELRTA